MAFSDLFSSANIGTTSAGAGAAVGLGLSAFGAATSYSAAKDVTAAQNRITGLEQQAEAQRFQAMELSANRQSMEQLRINQRARAMALSNATNQGAQFGSGLQGGYGQISGQSGVNLLGISQNLEIGQSMFGINSQISQQKIAMANAKSQEAQGQAWSSFGKSLSGTIEPLTRLATTAAPLLL